MKLNYGLQLIETVNPIVVKWHFQREATLTTTAIE
jgi:hypothetical protein